MQPNTLSIELHIQCKSSWWDTSAEILTMLFILGWQLVMAIL